MNPIKWLMAGVACTVLVVLGGCSGQTGVYSTISGTVTHNGAPVDNAKVNLHSTVEVNGKKLGPFSAMTDSSGKYLLAMNGKEPGIPPGMYKVTITKLDVKNPNLPPDFDQGQMEASGLARNLLPKDYENITTTKLSVTLEPGKNENKNFDLKGQASTTAKPTGTP